MTTFRIWQPQKRYFYQFSGLTIFFVWALVVLFLISWIWITLPEWGRKGEGHILKGIGSLTGGAGYLFFCFSLFLSSRWKKIEDFIGGLDQIYRLHHKMGMWGFYLLLVHPWIQALKWIPGDLKRFFFTPFPFHQRLSVNLGSLAFLLMLTLIGITIFKLLPYDKWKLTHKFMVLVFILATLHFLLSKRRFDSSGFSLALLMIPMSLGSFGILYKQVWIPLFYHFPIYKVTHVLKMNAQVVKITLEPETIPLRFVPGQYVFFSLLEKISREQHPFTICEFSATAISILVKVRGDFTKRLYQSVSLGDRARLDGPYGRFDYRYGLDNQVWIAGGIGIAPFLAWCGRIEKLSGRIDLFYCYHRDEDVLCLEKLESLRQKTNRFYYHLYCSEKRSRLTFESLIEVVKDVKGKEIFMCGPKRLTHDFFEKLKKTGVKRRHIHFEDFEFF